MKKLPVLLAITGLVASIGASARLLPSDASPFVVSVPNLKSGFEFNIEGLFLKPSNSDLDFGVIVLPPSSTGPNVSSIATLKPDTSFGLGTAIGYVFPNSANDVLLKWTTFDHTDTDTVSLSSLEAETSIGSTGAVTGAVIEDLLSPTDKEVASTRSRLNAIDLNAGQYISLGKQLQLHPTAGLRFARVESYLHSQHIISGPFIQGLLGSAVGPYGGYSGDSRFTSRFSGLGPSLGLDAHYNLGGGFAAVAHASTSLLLGKAETRLSEELEGPAYERQYFSPGVEEDISGGGAAQSDKTTRLVPVLDALLGLNYSCVLGEDASVLTFEGGYKASQYIDAVDRLTVQSNQWSGTPYSITRTSSSLGFSGPYVKLSLKI